MIQANELRIGNWVYYGESIRPVTSIHTSPQRKAVSVDNLLTSIEVLKPIPLTPEILEKAGFVGDDSRNDYRLDEFRVAFHIHEGVVEWIGERVYEFIPPLHQLQNLYFALTGEELIINL